MKKLTYGILIPTMVAAKLDENWEYPDPSFIERMGTKTNSIIHLALYEEDIALLSIQCPTKDNEYDVLRLDEASMNAWADNDKFKNNIGIILEEVLTVWKDYEMSTGQKEITLPETIEFNWYVL